MKRQAGEEGGGSFLHVKCLPALFLLHIHILIAKYCFWMKKHLPVTALWNFKVKNFCLSITDVDPSFHHNFLSGKYQEYCPLRRTRSLGFQERSTHLRRSWPPSAQSFHAIPQRRIIPKVVTETAGWWAEHMLGALPHHWRGNYYHWCPSLNDFP